MIACKLCGGIEPNTPALPQDLNGVFAHETCMSRQASLPVIQAEAGTVARSKWPEKRSVGELLVLIHSEVSEALEEYRSNNLYRGVYYHGNEDQKPLGWGVELADIIIRVAHLADETGVDLADVVRLKMEYNRGRPEKHGGKVI